MSQGSTEAGETEVQEIEDAAAADGALGRLLGAAVRWLWGAWRRRAHESPAK